MTVLDDPDAWPALGPDIHALGPVADWLRAEVAVDRAKGRENERITGMLAAVETTRSHLAQVELMSPLAQWGIAHPERYDVLDGISDCGSPDCPRTGFKDPKDAQMHHRRWDRLKGKP